MIYIIGPHNKHPDGISVINTTSRSDTWSRGLSPFFCGPVELYDGYVSQNVENAWQYSKVYAYYTDDSDNPDERYFKWAQDGWNSIRAHRYPMGKGITPLYSYWAGKKLSYIEARKKIYIPLYFNAVQKTFAFQKLKCLYEECQDICLWDFDAHGLEPGTFDYWELANNEKTKFGHAYVLAMMLEGKINEDKKEISQNQDPIWE